MSRFLTVQALIIGAGPAGIAAALGLQKLGISVALVDRESSKAEKFGEHLSPEAMAYLKRLDVLECVKQCHHLPCPGIQSAWGEEKISNHDYLLNPYGYGWNLLRRSFDTVLLKEATRRGVQVFLNTRVTSFSNNRNNWVVKLAQNSENITIQANFLVDATGRRAWLARKLHYRPIIYDQLIGVVGFIEQRSSNEPESSWLFLEACEEGWWYSAPLPDGQTVAAYMTDADLYRNKKLPPQVCWLRCLQDSIYTKDRLDDGKHLSAVYIRPAWSQMLKIPAEDHWIAVGDAAMSYDPLSSQGISKGLQWGIHMADIVKKRLEGDALALQIYLQKIQETFNQYLHTRREYYRMEKRWPLSVFWKRRQ